MAMEGSIHSSPLALLLQVHTHSCVATCIHTYNSGGSVIIQTGRLLDVYCTIIYGPLERGEKQDILPEKVLR